MSDQLPSNLEMAKNIATTARDTFKELLKGGKLFSDNSQAKDRMAICLDCELLNDDNRCTVCGCWMETKTKLQSSYCPKGKW